MRRRVIDAIQFLLVVGTLTLMNWVWYSVGR
jgi:hypothetical protein